jgi:hypothetical protein
MVTVCCEIGRNNLQDNTLQIVNRQATSVVGIRKWHAVQYLEPELLRHRAVNCGRGAELQLAGSFRFVRSEVIPMSCLIVLDDGRACAPAPMAFDTLVGAIADHLVDSREEQELAEWLRQQVAEKSFLGHCRIDLRELTPRNRRLFRAAVERLAYHFGRLQPADGTAVVTPAWVRRLRRLVKMMKSIDRGDAPEAISDVPAPVAPSGLLRGPGWCASV